MRPSPLARYFLAILLPAAAGVAGGAYWLKGIHPFESTDNAYLKAHMSLISSRETGYVKEVLFRDNQAVRAGDVLVVIDDRDFRARVDQAEARVAAEAARIRTLEADKQAQSARIRLEEANIAAAEADLERAAKDRRRFDDLARRGAVAAQARDAAESACKQAGAERDKARSARQEAESRMASLDARIAESRAGQKAAESDLELARIGLANTRIVAPMAGIVGNRSVQVGQLVKPGSALAYLIPGDGLFVEANFKETQISGMQAGQPVQIRLDAFPGQPFEGAVDSFSPASGAEFSLLPPENATGNFTKIVRRVPVKILFRPGTDLARFKAGLSALVKVRVR